MSSSTFSSSLLSQSSTLGSVHPYFGLLYDYFPWFTFCVTGRCLQRVRKSYQTSWFIDLRDDVGVAASRTAENSYISCHCKGLTKAKPIRQDRSVVKSAQFWVFIWILGAVGDEETSRVSRSGKVSCYLGRLAWAFSSKKVSSYFNGYLLLGGKRLVLWFLL